MSASASESAFSLKSLARGRHVLGEQYLFLLHCEQRVHFRRVHGQDGGSVQLPPSQVLMRAAVQKYNFHLV